MGLEEYASTLSELNTFISARVKSWKGFVWRYCFQIYHGNENIFAADLIGYLKNYGINNSFKRLCSKLHSTVHGNTQILLVILSSKYINRVGMSIVI